ncbi:hypothetical protein F5880DRAFT_1506423 [Lentinula raphanica]|nr:hypothetical protein F5880DRAFT_1506423 [Lentinula raphanica]
MEGWHNLPGPPVPTLPGYSKNCAVNWRAGMNSEFNDYAWEFLHSHCQMVSSPGPRLANALEELDIFALLNAALMRPETNVATIRTTVIRLKSIVHWAEELGRFGKQDTSISTTLPSRYREFKEKFRIQIPSHLGAAEREELRLAILVLKYDLCLNQPDMLDIISALMNRHLNPEEVGRILRSPCPNLVPTLDPTVTNAVDISFPHCHEEILSQILHINRTPSSLYVRDTIDYAKSQWINHLVETVPSPKNVKLLIKNVSSLQTHEDLQKARAWIENIKDPASWNESVRAFMKQSRVLELMDGVHLSQSTIERPRRRTCSWLTPSTPTLSFKPYTQPKHGQPLHTPVASMHYELLAISSVYLGSFIAPKDCLAIEMLLTLLIMIMHNDPYDESKRTINEPEFSSLSADAVLLRLCWFLPSGFYVY